MYYNPATKETLNYIGLKNKLNASIPFNVENVNNEWFLIHEGDRPEATDTHKVDRGEIELQDGIYVQTYVLVEMDEEELAARAEEKMREAKSERDSAIERLTVTVDDMVFDANEKSQERIARTILANSEDDEKTVEWVLADNTVATVNISQLKRVLSLATEAMSEIWVSVYETEEKESVEAAE